MKFEIGEKVKILASGKVGEIRQYRYDKYYYNGKIIETKRYNVYLSRINSTWHNEDELQHYYEQSPEFEIGLCNLLIDVYLSRRKFDLVKEIVNEKLKYQG